MFADMTEKMRVLNLYIANQRPPINVVGLANVLGIKVYNARWPDSISGKIQRDPTKGGESGFAIFVNASHSETRRRFTIAHEIAHYVLHEDRIGDGVFDDALYRSGLSNQEEREANGLAANILMPWQKLNPHVGKPLPELAEMFNVSEQAMEVRLGSFGAFA
jgi:hypothetical protein